jgi:hypothetical protein
MCPCIIAYIVPYHNKVLRQGNNPTLNQYDDPEISVRIGTDAGEKNTVIKCGWDIRRRDGYKAIECESKDDITNCEFDDTERKEAIMLTKPTDETSH